MDSAGHLYFSGSMPEPLRLSPSRPAVTERIARWPASALPAGAEAFLTWLLAQAGLDAAAYRSQSLVRRLPACLRSLRVSSTEAAREWLSRHPELIAPAIDTVLLGVTDFFRDEGVFNVLRGRVLPELLGERAHIRIWSAACSDGPELYTVAMILREAGWLPRADLVGTDCRPTAIMRAAAGVYPRNVVAQTPAWTRCDHFVPVGRQRVQMSDALREATRWRVVDLMQRAMPGPWDVILWRNMAIYLTPDAAAKVWQRVVGELRPGGFLLVGKADHPPRELPLERVATSVYRRAEDCHAA